MPQDLVLNLIFWRLRLSCPGSKHCLDPDGMHLNILHGWVAFHFSHHVLGGKGQGAPMRTPSLPRPT